MTRLCKEGKHVMVPDGDTNFNICKICKRYLVPTWNFEEKKENTIKTCCVCKERN